MKQNIILEQKVVMMDANTLWSLVSLFSTMLILPMLMSADSIDVLSQSKCNHFELRHHSDCWEFVFGVSFASFPKMIQFNISDVEPYLLFGTLQREMNVEMYART